MPRSFGLRLEQIQRDFLWGGRALERKPHLVSWSIVCLDKSKGGLGVRDLLLLNKSLLCKWNCRFAKEMETFWRQVMSRKYREEEGGWLREAYEVGLWKAIRKVGGLLSCRVAFLVGNGRNVRFGKDKWCGDEPLCISFPSLFVVASSKEAWVEEVWNHSIECKCWVPCFSRQINDWELETMEHFLLRLHGRRVSRDRDDEILWIESKNEAFSVKSLYKALYLGMQGVFPTSVIWNSWVLLRVVFLV